MRVAWTKEMSSAHTVKCGEHRFALHPTWNRLRCWGCGITIINRNIVKVKPGQVEWDIDDFKVIEWL